MLQKRLIAKTQECAERELAIREKDKLCPGPRAVALPPDPFVQNNPACFLDINELAQVRNGQWVFDQILAGISSLGGGAWR